MEIRQAGPHDAEAIAALHADSWRRHYRGAYLGSYLDGEVLADRQAVWRDRLAYGAHRHTLVAEHEDAVVGFAHLILDDDQRWGALLENIHVAADLKRQRVGSRLMSEMATVLQQRRPSSAMYLWVLEQNTAAQAFYLARGGVIVERGLRGPFPGGGTAVGLRVSWPDPAVLARSENPGPRPAAPVVVRPATFADLDGLLGLYAQLAEDRPSSLPAEPALARERFGDIARQPDRILLVAECDGGVVGSADLLIVRNLTHAGDPWAAVENVIVDQAGRRHGVGRALMTEVVRRCDDAGCYKIQLLSRKHRHEAHAFYASLGFEPVAEGFRRYRP